MKLYQRIKWAVCYQVNQSAPYAPQTTHLLFGGHLQVDRHFRGCECWSLEICVPGKPWIWCFPGGLMNFGGAASKRWILTARLGGPIISLTSRATNVEDDFRSVRIID